RAGWDTVPGRWSGSWQAAIGLPFGLLPQFVEIKATFGWAHHACKRIPTPHSGRGGNWLGGCSFRTWDCPIRSAWVPRSTPGPTLASPAASAAADTDGVRPLDSA